MGARRTILPADDDAVLRYIAGHVEARGYAPRLSDIAGAIGFSKSSVFLCLRRLEARGAIRRRAQLQQAIEVMDAPPIPRSDAGAPLFFIAGDRVGVRLAAHECHHNGAIGQDHA